MILIPLVFAFYNSVYMENISILMISTIDNLKNSLMVYPSQRMFLESIRY